MKEYRDHYFRKAKAENYPARSIYKLKEMDERYKLLRPGMHVLDLGAAPGSWSLGAAEKIGQSGVILACDIQKTDTHFPHQVRFMQENVYEFSSEFEQALLSIGPFDLVMSDMAPSTTGNRITDQARSFDLAENAFFIACRHLRSGGNFIVKIFMGPDTDNLLKSLRLKFTNVKIFKPKSSRAESKEIFFVALGLKTLL